MGVIRHDPNAHEFSTEMDGSRANLDYTLTGGVMTITHTWVPPEIGGRGVAGQLMDAALGAAKDAGWSVNPICSYAAAYMAKRAAAEKTRDACKQHVDELLDEALEESFPASDSPAVGGAS